jgi:hypothetical protein
LWRLTRTGCGVWLGGWERWGKSSGGQKVFFVFFISLYLEELVEYDKVIFEALSRLWWL